MSFREAIRNRNFFLVLIDLLMMVLLLLNLGLIIFDWIYSFDVVNKFFATSTPDFYNFYQQQIHENFFEIDLVFISVFLVEFVISWFISAVRHEYHRWFFYPFVHWYDLIGCVPIDAFRFVRILRIYSILYRLHKLHIINLARTYIYQKLMKYFNILVEEVSDRVVVNVINGVQEELRAGSPVMDDIVKQAVRPRQVVIAEWLSHRVKKAVEQNYSRHQELIKDYVDRLIREAVRENEEMKTLDFIPVMGKAISLTVERTVSGVVYNVIDKAIRDLASDANRVLVNEITEILIDSVEAREDDDELQKFAIEMFLQSLEIIKEQVKVQQWKVKEEEEKTQRIENLEDATLLKHDSENQEAMEIVDNLGDLTDDDLGEVNKYK